MHAQLKVGYIKGKESEERFMIITHGGQDSLRVELLPGLCSDGVAPEVVQRGVVHALRRAPPEHE